MLYSINDHGKVTGKLHFVLDTALMHIVSMCVSVVDWDIILDSNLYNIKNIIINKVMKG